MSNENTGPIAGTLDTGGTELSDRDFLQAAIEAAGGTITDSGAGCGSMDLGYLWNGVQYGVSLSRRTKTAQAA